MSLVRNVPNPKCCNVSEHLCPKCKAMVPSYIGQGGAAKPSNNETPLPLPTMFPNRENGRPPLADNDGALPLPNTIEVIVNERSDREGGYNI